MVGTLPVGVLRLPRGVDGQAVNFQTLIQDRIVDQELDVLRSQGCLTADSFLQEG